ncbi:MULTISPECIES: DNA alkylation repair protein [unclassified Pedobacter]|uniref:DNA alkylation repair protein n=1 Tax=unclassified Pedobacter TaxID=2628915 RepID=UPI00141E84DE|nr:MULTISPECIES: DNA alkylation repair protein [unclassified Pedobacter]NII83847.1 3-methyladenine DNA glycosylase AlkD [Pedobacter sp. SG908]NMN37697.1 3-methyladenine DNA glycosylase AlkD [Pedobacter sp. SG918]
MNLTETLSKLESLGEEKVRAMHIKNGARENIFGVKMGNIRAIAKKIKTDHELALKLWETENIDARLLAILILKPKALSAAEIEQMVSSENFTWAADWFYNYIVKEYPDKEQFREKWMNSENVMLARAGWSLTSGRIAREPEGIDIPSILDRIEKEMPKVAPEIQWTMNTALAQIGINHPDYRERALAIGEKLGIYRDYPVSKGCTSPFAPIWINEMVSRQK